MAKKTEEIKKDDDIQEKIEQEIKEHINESELKTMNIYEKLQYARVQLLKMNFSKSGKNKYSDYEYFELGDFLPNITTIFNSLKLFSKFDIQYDEAILTIINIEKPEEKIEFKSPYIKAVLKDKAGGEPQPIQGLGASHTYLRRYLYINALEITEFDTVNRLLNETLRNERSEIEKAIKYIHDNYKDFQYDIEQFINENELYGIDNLMVDDAKALCEHIKRLKDLKKIGEKSRDGKTKFEMKEGK